MQAAGELFVERGYARATVNAIAQRAGVSVQTLYLAAEGKRQLLRAYIRTVITGSADAPEQAYHDRLREAVAAAGDDPVARVRAIARVYRLIAERAALGWHLYRDAAAIEPDIAADWHTLQKMRRSTLRIVLEQLPPTSLRPGLDPEAAVDTAWAIASPETYEVLVRHGDHTLDAYEAWVADTLVAALLDPALPAESR